MMESKIKLGISLYSFTIDYFMRRYDLEACLATAKELGAEGIEIVAAMMVPGYPWPTEAWMDDFQRLLKKYGLAPVSYSAYVDMGLRTDRDLNEDEIVQFTINDMQIASRMGFPVVRTQHAISPEILEKMLPYAEKLNVWLGVELHVPHTIHVPVWKQYFALFEKYGSKNIGIVPDFGVFQEYPHLPWFHQAAELGMRRKILDVLLPLQRKGVSEEEALKLVPDLTDAERPVAHELFKDFHPAALEDLAPMVKHSRYMHGKFYHIDENGFDACIPYEKILPILRDNGFEGFIASEYEGHQFDESIDATEQLKRHLSMEKRILGL